ncbi:acyl-CoA carboxylase subunit epsilon [Naumannella huperziae]
MTDDTAKIEFRGNPTPEEVAAVIAVLRALPARGDRAGDDRDGSGGWARRWRLAGSPLTRDAALSPGPGSWQAVGRP